MGHQNGKLAELHFEVWLTKQGYEVATPSSEAGPVDVLWREFPGGPWRSAQVKKVYMKNGRPTVNLVRYDDSKYGAADCDFLAAVDYEAGHMWLVRFDAVCDKTRMVIRDTWDKYKVKL